MTAGRLSFVIACVSAALVSATFATVGWDSTNRFVTLFAAAAALAALAAALWLALPETPPVVPIYGSDRVDDGLSAD